MPTIIERAVAGHMKSMQELYEANKKELYTFCCMVLRNAAQAKTASENVISEIWSRAKDQRITEEDQFRRLMMQCAARQCRKILFGKDARAFRLSRVMAFTPYTFLEEEYTGDVTEGTNKLLTALESIEAPRRFVYLLHTVGKLDNKKISEIIEQREEVVRYDYATAVIELNQILGNSGSLNVARAASLAGKAAGMAVCPESMEKNCTAMMESRAVSDLPPKPVLIGIGVGVVCLLGILIAVFASGGNEPVNNTTDLSGEIIEDTSETEDTGGDMPETSLDTSLTYYADITIEDYGTVTVLLDEESAPITVENFVTLAEDGFYDGLTFHRIIDGFMMQGGDPNGDGSGGSENTIVGEFTENGYNNSLSHTAGAISMARSSEYDSASSQFFIVHEDSTYLDGQYAVFGYVTDDAGMAIVDEICTTAEPTDDNGTIPAENQPVITSVVIRTESGTETETNDLSDETEDITSEDTENAAAGTEEDAAGQEEGELGE